MKAYVFPGQGAQFTKRGEWGAEDPEQVTPPHLTPDAWHLTPDSDTWHLTPQLPLPGYLQDGREGRQVYQGLRSRGEWMWSILVSYLFYFPNLFIFQMLSPSSQPYKSRCNGNIRLVNHPWRKDIALHYSNICWIHSQFPKMVKCSCTWQLGPWVLLGKPSNTKWWKKFFVFFL